jgi:hypothetical protein
MPRWAGRLTWRCRSAVGRSWRGRRWSSRSWGRWRSATGRRRCGCRGPRSGPCWPTCWSTPGGSCRRTGWSRTCGATTRRGTRPTPSRAGCRPCAGPLARPAERWRPGRPAMSWRPARSRSTPAGSSAWSPRPPRLRPAKGRGRPGSWRRRWGCGAAPRWPSSPTSRGPRPRRPGWRSCAWPPPRPWSSCAWPPAGTPGWWGSWRGWWRPIRPGNGCGASCWSPCTGRAARPTPSAPTSGPARCWPRSWGSTRRRSCSGSTTRSCSRTRPSRRRPRTGPCPGTTCPSG